MPTDLFTAFQEFDDSVSQHVKQYSGLLGLPVTSKTVEVPNRNGYVYVRLRDNTSEIVQAYNEKVSPVYNLPVIIERQGNRWVVVNRDIERYENWGSYSAFLPAHAHQHEFNRDNPGGDTVFVYPQQITPLLMTPSGTNGGPNVVMQQYSYKKGQTWILAGVTGTASIVVHKPLDNTATVGLLYFDKTSGNPGFLLNTGTSVGASVTGVHDLLQYLPDVSNDYEPAAMVRIVSGTTVIGWENLYDVRQWFGGSTTGTSGGGGGIEEAPIDGLLYGRKNAGWIEVSGTAGGDGTPGGSDKEVQYNESGSFGATPKFYYDYDNNVLRVGDISLPTFGSTEIHLIASGTSPALALWATSNNSAVNPYIKASRYRGNFDAAIEQFDEIFQLRGSAYDGTSLSATRVELLFDAPYNWSSSSHPTRASIWITASGSTTMQNAMEWMEYGVNLQSNKTYNIDGSPIADAEGWTLVRELWTRTGNHTFTTTAELQKGDKIRYKDGGAFEYGVVAYVSGSAPSTIGLITNSDYAMAAANITDRYFSRVENPYGFPTVFNFTPVVTNLTIGNGTLVGYWDAHGDTVKGRINVIFGSTTSSGGAIQFDYPSSHKTFAGKRESLGVTVFWDNDAALADQVWLGNTVHNAALDKMVPQITVQNGTSIVLLGTASLPFTWAVDDELSLFFEYPMG